MKLSQYSRNIVFISLALFSSACAEKRTKYSDRVMTIMIDPDSIRPDDYVRLQDALVQSNKWTVLDRHSAFEAIKKEQEREHKKDQDQFDNAHKWAMWGKMYGVGGVVVANSQCQTETTFFGHNYLHCLQSLSVVDTNTTEVITHISYMQDGEADQLFIAPTWENSVYELNKSFPENFHPAHYTERLRDVMKEAKERGEKDTPQIEPNQNKSKPAIDPTYKKDDDE